ncbi:MAG: DUF763 domain-containing protein [Candidatus Asgardarchaeia archaeon]
MSLHGLSDLPLHRGKAPKWLIRRMEKLAKCIVELMIEEYGKGGFIERISNPFWFQSLGNVLGFDWHSSGVTTVVTGVLKSVVEPSRLGVAVCGGKGKSSLNTLNEIEKFGRELDIGFGKIEEFKRISRIVAKVDNAVLQDGFSLYHHTFFFTDDGKWAVIQQGMSIDERMARRYHWVYKGLKDMVEKPHVGIVSEKIRKIVLDLTSEKSRGNKRTSLDLIKDGVKKLRRAYLEALSVLKGNERLFPIHSMNWRKVNEVKYLKMPRRIDWSLVKKIYERQPSRFEELIEFRGVGPGFLRALSLVSNIIYGEEVSWEDPVKYSFAFGGKDGVPFPVKRDLMDDVIEFLKECVRSSDISHEEKVRIMKKLSSLIS